MYVEIILPLPLYSTFTYEVPVEIEKDIQTGARVLVQFGKKKYYTGIVAQCHYTTPEYDVKPIMALLDTDPIVRYPQLNLWKWISDYYLCSVGDVYKAAVPTGLKPESETYVTLNDDFDSADGVKLTDRQSLIIMMLQQKKKMRISEIEQETKFRNTAQIINTMIDMRLLLIDEKIVEKYKAKRETYIEINASRGDQERLRQIFDMTKRSQQQEKALLTYLERSKWMSPTDDLLPVSRRELLDNSRISPSVLRAMIDKGIFRQEKRVLNRFNPSETDHDIRTSPLSAVQQMALESIRAQFVETQTVLLHGVTGSGKTEIYTHLIAASLKDGNQVLYLVPEISLTTQLTDRLRAVFGDRLLVYHSKFSDSERVDIWKRVLESHEPMVILGARSAIFLPFAHLGLIIVDEEHESSFKQYDPAPRYNARDTATVLARMHGAKVLLGSATPSVETYYKAQSGKYGLTTLSERYEGSVLPDVEIVDMREQRKKKLNKGVLSSSMIRDVRQAVSDGRQAILFQNRRGFAPVVVCRQCGWTPKCENCDVSLVYHKHINLLKCHYCGFSRTLPNVCPACGQATIDVYGYGTERIAEEVHAQFPDARIARMDLDTTRNKDAYQEIIEEFAGHRTDILVGTQMVTKGLDFDDVRLAGVINADTLLNFPDFRSNERAFNMLEQVAGRAGRRKEKGEVLIQTTDPKNQILEFVRRHDYQAYYNHEINERRQYNYPPFTKIINVYIRNKDAATADRGAVLLTMKMREIFGSRVLGPEKPFVSRVAQWYIQSIMLKIESGASMTKVKQLLRDIYVALASSPDIRTSQIYYDVDPA